MTGTDIAAFIETRLGEDEAAAKTATPGPWEFEGDDPTDDELFSVHDGEHGDLVGDTVAYTRGYSQQVPNGVHMARHNPARVLREVAAMRAILREYQAVGRLRDLTGGDHDRYREWMVRHLAGIWSDHPDYVLEWAPKTSEVS